jgi:hypothetical protein
MRAPRCWFADLPGAGPCDGALVRCHLVAQQLLKREFPHGAWRLQHDGFDGWVNYLPLAAQGEPEHELRWPHLPLRKILDDPRCWVWGCGGPTGVGGHHGRLDYSRTLRVPRSRLPAAVEAFCEQLGLSWWLSRTYGEKEGVPCSS